MFLIKIQTIICLLQTGQNVLGEGWAKAEKGLVISFAALGKGCVI